MSLKTLVTLYLFFLIPAKEDKDGKDDSAQMSGSFMNKSFEGGEADDSLRQSAGLEQFEKTIDFRAMNKKPIHRLDTGDVSYDSAPSDEERLNKRDLSDIIEDEENDKSSDSGRKKSFDEIPHKRKDKKSHTLAVKQDVFVERGKLKRTSQVFQAKPLSQNNGPNAKFDRSDAKSLTPPKLNGPKVKSPPKLEGDDEDDGDKNGNEDKEPIRSTHKRPTVKVAPNIRGAFFQKLLMPEEDLNEHNDEKAPLTDDRIQNNRDCESKQEQDDLNVVDGEKLTENNTFGGLKSAKTPASGAKRGQTMVIPSQESDKDSEWSGDEVDLKDHHYRSDENYAHLTWIIFPDDSFKGFWEIIIAINLLYTAVVLPFEIAFYNPTPNTYVVIDDISLGIWCIDLILTFFSAYEDRDENLIYKKKDIARNYFRGWFYLDLISCIPFNYIFNNDNLYTAVLRVAKISKLARVLRLAKISKYLKNLPEHSFLYKIMERFIKSQKTFDKLFLNLLYLALFFHINSCVWFFVGTFDPNDESSWVNQNNLENSELGAQYLTSFYFVVATVMTIGYGDIHPGNSGERIFSIYLMFTGALVFTYILGTLSSHIIASDQKNRIIDQRIDSLIYLKHKLSINNDLYEKIKRAVKSGHRKQEDERTEFINELPGSLKTDLSVVMYKENLKDIYLFRKKNRRFLGAIGPVLRQFKLAKGDYIFTEGEYANESKL